MILFESEQLFCPTAKCLVSLPRYIVLVVFSGGEISKNDG